KQILFVSDVLEELKAASEAGLKVVQMVRDDSQRTGDFRTITSFSELKID
ncbi:acireductone synthase, partial [Shewanella sp. 0m-11]